MSKLQIANIKITNKNVVINKVLKETIELINNYAKIDSAKLLKFNDWQHVSFELHNTYVGFANGLRRALKEELPATCLGFDEADLSSDDEFIIQIGDNLVKQINLVPIDQEIKSSEFDSYTIYLNKVNTSNIVIDVYASDIKIVANSNGTDPKLMTKTNKPTRETVDIEQLVIVPRTIICRLRPGKFVKINKLRIERGYQCHDAAKFTLINGTVSYQILDVEPYNIETKTGVRSIEANPTKFKISFEVIKSSGMYVISLLVDELTRRLKICRDNVIEYKKIYAVGKTDLYCALDILEVHKKADYTEFRFNNEYYTMAGIIAQRCYLLDTKNVLLATGTADRFDSNICIIKLNHPQPIDLLIKAFDATIEDLQLLLDQFSKMSNTDSDSKK